MPELLHPQIGFSTGSMFEVHPHDHHDRLSALESEVGKSNLTELELFLWSDRSAGDLVTQAEKGMTDRLLKYSRISIHATRCREFRYLDGSVRSAEAISTLKQLNQLYKPEYIVFHPDWIADFSALTKLDLPIALENMDARNDKWKRPEPFIPLVKDGIQLVIDVGHVLSLNLNEEGSMLLLNTFLQTFDEQVAGFHISDCETDTGLHRPLAGSKRETTGRKMVSSIFENSQARLMIESVFSEANYKHELVEEVALLNSC